METGFSLKSRLLVPKKYRNSWESVKLRLFLIDNIYDLNRDTEGRTL
jgi:hypothetical protein